MAIMIDRLCADKGQLVSDYLKLNRDFDRLEVDMGCFIVRNMHDNYLYAQAKIQAAEETESMKREAASNRFKEQIMKGQSSY